MAKDPADLVRDAVRDLLGMRLTAFVKYGSSVTGDVLIGYSDLDLAIGREAPVTLSETLALHQVIGKVDPEPYSYFQPTFVLGQPSEPLLTPGAFDVLSGAIAERSWVCGADDLRAKGEAWLGDLSRLIASDAGDWAMTSLALRSRQARLHLTRVKPSLRALLVRAGCPPVDAWNATWEQIAVHFELVDQPLGEEVRLLLAAVRTRQDHTVAEAALGVAARVCVDYLHEDGSGSYLSLS